MPVLRIDALKDARRIPMHDDKLFDPGVGTTLYDLATRSEADRPFRDAAIERALPRRHRRAVCARTTHRPRSTRATASLTGDRASGANARGSSLTKRE